MFRTLTCFYIIMLSSFVFAQNTGPNIAVHIANYAYDSLVLGYHYGGAHYKLETLHRNDQGGFNFKQEEELEPGIYIFILSPSNSYVEVLIDKDQDFEVNFDVSNPIETWSSKGSELNSLFYTYLQWLMPHQNKIKRIQDQLKVETILAEEKDRLQIRMDTINTTIKTYQKNIVRDHPESFVAALVKSYFQTEFPDFIGTPEEQELAKWHFYRSHYFDNMSLSDARLIRTPLLTPRIHHYLEKLTTLHPDSLIKTVDYLLGGMSANPETFNYGLALLLNKYAKSNIVGFDAIYVHIIEKYYAKGLAPWVEPDVLNKLTNTAKKLKPILIGKKAPNFTSYTQSGETITLHDMDYDYIVLFFWAPDCAHCKKASPQIIEFQNAYASKGVKVLATCTKSGQKEKGCWEMVKEKGLDVLLNTSDPRALSKFQVMYDIRTTPQIFILNRDKEIIMKKIGADQLGSVMDSILKNDIKEAK